MEAAPSVWRNRDVLLLVSGGTVNNIGDWLLELALPLYVFIETESGLQTAGVYVLRLGVTFLFGPLGGRLADTWRLKSTLVTTNLLQILALAPLVAVSENRVWPIALVVVLQGLISSVNDPASFALLPRLVDGDQFVAANSAFSAASSIARLAGAAAGGIALEFGGIAMVAVLDGATFALGALASSLLSSRADIRPSPRGEGEIDVSIRAAVVEVRARPALAAVLSIQGISMMIYGGFPVLFIVFFTDVLGSGESEIGIIRASSALGGLVAAAVVGSIASRITSAKLMAGGYLLFFVVSLLFVNAPSITTALWVYLVLYGATGFPNVAAGVGIQSAAQELCPAPVLGRFGGLMSAVSSFGMGLGAIVFGALLEVATARTLLNIEAAMFFVCAAIAYVFIVRASSPGEPNLAVPSHE